MTPLHHIKPREWQDVIAVNVTANYRLIRSMDALLRESDVGRAVSEQKSGKVEYRVDKSGIVHCSIGKRSFEATQLIDNAGALIDAIEKAKPAATKGTYMKSIALSTTMGPGFAVDQASLKL